MQGWAKSGCGFEKVRVWKTKDREGHVCQGHGAAGSSQRRNAGVSRGKKQYPAGRRPGAGQVIDKELSQPQGGEDRPILELQGGPGAWKWAEGAVSPWPRNETRQVRPGLTCRPREDSPAWIPGSLNQDHVWSTLVWCAETAMEGRLRKSFCLCPSPRGL